MNKPYIANFIAKILIFLYKGTLKEDIIKDNIPVKVYYVKRFFLSKINGQTWGNYVFIKDTITDPIFYTIVLTHEIAHVRQYYKYNYLGIGFILLYSWYFIKYGYIKNPLEIEARDNERSIL